MEGQRFAEIVSGLVSDQDDRQRRVLELRFGLSDGQSRTLDGVGSEFKVTRERIRQIEAKALRRIRRRNNYTKLAWAIHAEIGDDRRSHLRAYSRLKNALANGGLDHPEQWMALLAKAFPEYHGFSDQSPELERFLYRFGTLVVYRSEFIEALTASGVAVEDAETVWSNLRLKDTRYYWLDDAAVERQHAALAYYVLKQRGEPSHWREIHKHADDITADRDLSASTLYNAIGNSPLFVRTAPGTYGLHEWGVRRARYQKDVIAEVFADNPGFTLHVRDVVASLDASRAGIPSASTQMYLYTNATFYEDIDGKFGLREWLPPPEEQRLDTPRRLRESKRSRERLSR